MKNGKAPASGKALAASVRKNTVKRSGSRKAAKASRRVSKKTVVSDSLSRSLKVLSNFYS